jgi:hypothetical protein
MQICNVGKNIYLLYFIYFISLYYLFILFYFVWSSGQSSWLQIRRPGFDSRHYQNKKIIVGLEWGPLSLVSTTEELLGRKSSGYGRAIWIRHADHMAPSIQKSCH